MVVSEHEPKPVAYKTPYFENGRDGKLIPIYAEWNIDEPASSGWEPLYPASVVTALQEEVGRLKRAVQTLEMVVNRTENQWVKWEAAAHTAEARANAAEQRLKEAVKVLEPFAMVAGYNINAGTSASVMVNVDRCRDARAFIKEPTK